MKRRGFVERRREENRVPTSGFFGEGVQKMNVLASECSSGCESGWTVYFEQSFLSANPPCRAGFCDEYKEKRVKEEEDEEGEEEEEEEDLSMVSDASSGPPHLHEEQGYSIGDYGCQYSASRAAALLPVNGGKRQRNKEHRRREDQEPLPSFLDDTASSPLINFSNNNFSTAKNEASLESALDYSQGFSATHFQGRSTFQDHFGFFQSSLPENQLQNNQWH